MKQNTYLSPSPIGWDRSRSIVAALFVLAVFLATFQAATAGAKAVPDSFADLAAKLGPTVVNIYTTQTIKSQPHQFMFPDMQGSGN